MRLLPRNLNVSSGNLPTRRSLGQRRVRPSTRRYNNIRNFSDHVKNTHAAISQSQELPSSTRHLAAAPMVHVRSYSSETTQTSMSPPPPTATDTISLTQVEEDMDALLVTACNQARDISELVKTKQREKGTKPPPTTPKEQPSSPPKTIIIVEPPKFESAGEALDQISKSWDIQHELQASEALLKITSHPSFHTALASKRKEALLKPGQEHDVVALSLHNGFLAVTHWLCSSLSSCEPLPIHGLEDRMEEEFHQFGDATVSQLPILSPTKESVLLNHLLNLMGRCHHLNLPLTLPIYQKIISLTARYSTSTELAYILLDLSTQVRNILFEEEDEGFNPDLLSASFFAPVLKDLLSRNRLRDMVEVLHGMKSIHGIRNVDLTTGMELLSLLNSHVEDLVKGDGSSTGTLHGALLDEADAMEVALLLQRPVMEELDSKKKELEEYQAQCGVTMDTILDSHDDDENESDDDLESLNASVEPLFGDNKERNDIDNPNRNKHEQEVAAMTDYLMKEINEEMSPAKLEGQLSKEFAPSDMTLRFHVNQSTGEVENVEFLTYNPIGNKKRKEIEKKLKGWQRSILRDMVYMRDSESWHLPDIVTQLEEWNFGRGLLFTKEYETELMNEIADEEDSFDLTFDDEN